MRRAWLAVVALAALAGPAAAQRMIHTETPAACANAATESEYRACADATSPGSSFHWLSLMHLGMLAMQRQDVAEAVRLFDLAVPAQGENFTRPRLHGYKAAAYNMVGRDDDALREAHITLSLLMRTRQLPDDVWPMLEDAQINNEAAFAAILPILQKAGDPDFRQAYTAYMALPVQS